MSSRLFQKSLDQCSYIFKTLFILSHIFHSIIFIILLTKYTRNCISFHSIFLHPNQRPNQNPVQYLFLFVEIIDDTRFGLRERQNQMENKEMEIQCDVSFEIAPKRKINLGQKKGRNAEREWWGDSCFNSVIQVSGGFQSPRARKSWSGRGSASREGERNWRGSWSLAICQDRRRERFHVCEKRSRSCGVLLVSFHPPPAVAVQLRIWKSDRSDKRCA